jgi:glycosyltransferase involved in cell wall biosynthesis
VATVEIVIPVLNEERALPPCVEKLSAFLAQSLAHHDWKIVIADNGSTDGTLDVAKRLAAEHPNDVGYVHLDRRGRGLALRKAWLESDADVVAYMDVDLSTGLEALPTMVDAIAKDGVHVAFGSRLKRGARIKRSVKREVISRAYNMIIRFTMWTRFEDAQCGFKALSRGAAQALVPLVVNNHWFFDTELLVIAEKSGFRMLEVPVTWDEDADTRVKIVGTAVEDLKGLARLRFRGIPRVTPPTGLRG